MKFKIEHENYKHHYVNDLFVGEVLNFIEAFRAVKPLGDKYDSWRFREKMTTADFEVVEKWNDVKSGFNNMCNRDFYIYFCDGIEERELRIVPFHNTETFMRENK